MRFQPAELDGAWLVDLEPHRDERGAFARTFCVREYGALGLETNFVQHSSSCTLHRGAVRGLHFQRPPHGEVKVVACTQGVIFDVIIDLRPTSPTFRQWRGYELSSENQRRLYIPKGFAHGFQTLSHNAIVSYLISTFYEASASYGVRYNDPAFAISWPLTVTTVSEKDTRWPNYAA